MPDFFHEFDLPGPRWELYGGLLRVNVPDRTTFTPSETDADPIPCQVQMTLDVVDGRLVCISLTAQQLDGGPPITSELLRRIPVATWVRSAALDGRFVVEERVDGGNYAPARERPPADFAKHGITDVALDQFARLYALEQVTGGRPSGVLLADYGMPRATFSRWLATARRRGILVESHRRTDLPPTRG